MGILDIFKRKKPEPLFKGRVFDFHEDDFALIELLPIENIEEIIEDSKAIQEINENHTSQFGFTKIHVLNEKKVKTIDRKIERTEIEAILEKTIFKKFDNVTTGYGSMQYDSEYSVAFGKQGCVIIYEFNKNLVDKIWLKYYPAWAKEDGQANMLICLSEIGQRWDFILVDWNQNIQVNLSDENELKTYLSGDYLME